MRLMINHQTHYQYTDQARNSIQYIKMTPTTNVHQQVHSWNVSVPDENKLKTWSFIMSGSPVHSASLIAR